MPDKLLGYAFDDEDKLVTIGNRAVNSGQEPVAVMEIVGQRCFASETQLAHAAETATNPQDKKLYSSALEGLYNAQLKGEYLQKVDSPEKFKTPAEMNALDKVEQKAGQLISDHVTEEYRPSIGATSYAFRNGIKPN
jgi:hypothetical protein